MAGEGHGATPFLTQGRRYSAFRGSAAPTRVYGLAVGLGVEEKRPGWGALPVYRRFTRISPTAGGQWSAPAPSQRDLSTGVPPGGGRPTAVARARLSAGLQPRVSHHDRNRPCR